MQTELASFIRDTPAGRVAERILRACVHCGFCNATCPTYQLLGDELDGPRGRIYLVKQLLEGEPASRRTLDHLDRCLTCRSCETTCPSGVEYGRLADIGREVAEERIGRAWPERLLRRALRLVLPFPRRVRTAYALARTVRRFLPASIAEQVPVHPHGAAERPISAGTDAGAAAVLLEGCVQPALAPGINSAAARVLARLGIRAVAASGAGCCGALSHHLAAPDEARAFMRRNIDAWIPQLDAGAASIVVTASGCAAVVKEYGHLLRDDPAYAEPAVRVSRAARDLAEVVDRGALARLAPSTSTTGSVAFHSPCTLQHGQKLGGTVEGLLAAAGIRLTRVGEPHLCCGSAGTYSILQPTLSERLLERKLTALQADKPAEIATANIGCLLHLGRRARVPVRHWIELVDERLAVGDTGARGSGRQ